MRRRWAAFLVAAAGSAMLAAGFGTLVSRLVGTPQPAPSLRTVSTGTLARAGITVAAPDQPPYCDAEHTVAERSPISTALAGCAITDREAEAALLPAFRANVTEAVLARVSGPAASGIGKGRLVWLVVVQSSLLVLPTTACAPPVASGPACAAPRMGQPSGQAIVFVDGSTGQVLTTLPVPGPAAGPSSR